MKELRTKTDAIINNLYLDLEKTAPGSQNYKETVEAYVKLLEVETKMYEAESKAAIDYDKAEAEKAVEKETRRGDIIKMAATLFATLFTGALSVWEVSRITRFESDGGIVRSEAKNHIIKPKKIG